MSGGFRWWGDPWRMSLEQFTYWCNTSLPEWKAEQIKRRGKPRVRVPVERQTPNEADL